MNPKDNPQILELKKPWESNENNVWLASVVRFSRNIEKFNFPGKLDVERRKQVVSIIAKELLGMELLQKPYLVKAENISPLEKQFLTEHFLRSDSFNQTHAGEGFVLDETGQFLACLNLQDHLQLTLMDSKGELENSWNKLLKIETLLGKSLNFTFSPKFGFLTSDFNECGTGLVVSIFLQLPGLLHTEKINEILEKMADESIGVTGIHGNPTEIIGDVVVIQNNYTLGVTEESIISSLRAFTTKVLVEENSCRNQIRHSKNGDMKDKISRAFGILAHSYQIEAIEALNALSLLKLGIDMDWIEGIDVKLLNQLFFHCRRSHLLTQFKEKINQDEIIHKRAEYIHSKIKNAHLKI